MRAYVYCLYEISSGDIFYIGSTVNMTSRLHQHNWSLVNDKRKSPVHNYILNNNISFAMSELDSMIIKKRSDIMWLESYWISQLKQWGFQLQNSHLYHSVNFPATEITQPNKYKAISVRFGNLKGELQEVAIEQGISLNKVVLIACRKYLESIMPQGLTPPKNCLSA